MLSSESRRVAGILLVVFPTVLYGGVSLLMFLLDRNSGYMENPLRQNLFRAGHAYAGVLLVLSLVALRYVDEPTCPKDEGGMCALPYLPPPSSCRQHFSSLCFLPTPRNPTDSFTSPTRE
jgi:hypothetical protein